MKKAIRITGICIISVILATLLLSCNVRKITEEEAIEKATALMSEVYDLNEIYFGKGLAFTDDQNEDTLYSPCTEDAKFRTQSELVAQTNKIFSANYAGNMISIAFSGAQGGVESSALYPRYIVGQDGYLTVFEKIKGIEVSLYDVNTIKITKIKSKTVTFDISNDGGETTSVTMILEKDGWKIDSATY